MTKLHGGYTPRPTTTPTPTTSFAIGQRAVLVHTDEVTGTSRYERDYRVVSDTVTTVDGTRWVKVATEPAWYAWTVGAHGAQCPHALLWPAELVWTE